METLYTPRDGAAEILGERQNDSALITRVEEFLDNELPADTLKADKISAHLARYLPDVSRESLLFAEQASEDGFDQILWAGYRGDRYVSSNSQKSSLVKPTLLFAKGQRRRMPIVEPMQRRGGIGDLTTIYGESLLEYYQNMREIVFVRRGQADLSDATFDMTNWYRSQAIRFGWQENDPNLSRYYYKAIMALITVFAVLYKQNPYNNPSPNAPRQFTELMIRPAFTEVEKALGVRPIIVAMDYTEGLDETDLTFLPDDQQRILVEQGSRALKSAILDGRND